MKPNSFSILVLNYNGAALLQDYLPSVVKAARTGDHEVILVDNHSQDESPELAEKLGVDRVLRLTTNRFLANLIEGARVANHSHLVILNNDIYLDSDYLNPLKEAFADPKVFCVGSSLFNPDGRSLQIGRVAGHFSRGLLEPGYALAEKADSGNAGSCLTLYAPGGSAAFCKRRFLELGGFDPLFLPLYYEDVDICYAGWRRGWKTIYEPRAVALHRESSTVGAATPGDWKSRARLKNHILVTLKNVSSPVLLRRCFRYLLDMTAECLRGKERWRLGALLDLSRQLPLILQRRREAALSWCVPDLEICPEHRPGGVRNGLGVGGALAQDFWHWRDPFNSQVEAEVECALIRIRSAFGLE